MEKINVAELLKNCQKGMELDCTMFENVTFEEVVTEIDCDSGNEDISIVLLTHYSDGMVDEITLTEYGTYTYGETAKCVIFPKGKTTWEGFQIPFKEKMKEIHFYKDTFGMSDFCYESALKTHSATVRAIQNGWDTIYTYAISTLDFSWLLDKGYKIFLHENGKCGEVHEGTTELTDKELSKHHDIRRIWIGGGFEDFFYSKDE